MKCFIRWTLTYEAKIRQLDDDIHYKKSLTLNEQKIMKRWGDNYRTTTKIKDYCNKSEVINPLECIYNTFILSEWISSNKIVHYRCPRAPMNLLRAIAQKLQSNRSF